MNTILYTFCAALFFTLISLHAKESSSTENKPNESVKPSQLEAGVYKDSTDPKIIVTYKHLSDELNSLKVEKTDQSFILDFVTYDDKLQILVTVPGDNLGKVFLFKKGEIFLPAKLNKDEIEYAATLLLSRSAYVNVIKANPRKFKVAN